jgi:hypothetical protein
MFHHINTGWKTSIYSAKRMKDIHLKVVHKNTQAAGILINQLSFPDAFWQRQSCKW